LVNGKWVMPAKTGVVGPQGVPPKKSKLGTSAVERYLKSGKGGKPPADGGFDPTKDFPGAPALTAYPNLQTLPDGSEIPDTPADTFKRTSASLLDPRAYAKLEGSAAYQPTIDALTGQQRRLGSGISQANSMLDSAYGGAADAAYKGAQTVKDSNAQANQSLTDLAARLAQVAGGDPTAAAAVGQESANAQTDNTRFANIAAQGQSDQAAAAQRDLGIAKLGYKSSTDSAIANLAEKIGTARTAGSQAQGAAIKDALGFNSDQRTAGLNRDVASLEARTAAKLAGVQVTGGKLANEVTRAGLISGKNSSAVADWKNWNDAKQTNFLTKIQAVTDRATAEQVKQELNKGKTPMVELALGDRDAYNAISSDLNALYRNNQGPSADPGKVFTGAVGQLASQYPDASHKAVVALARRYAQGQLVQWNATHAKAQAKSKMTWKMVNGAPALVKQ
jgi:hypothetical protein